MDEASNEKDRNLDAGVSVEIALQRAQTRNRQLQAELKSRQAENESIVAENLRQNEALRTYSEDMGSLVKMRTWELEVAKHKLEIQARQLKEVGEAKEALMHMIVHDMKNPLTAVLGALAMFKRNAFGLEEELHGMLLDAHGQSLRLLSMIEEILIISRMRSKEFQIQAQPVVLEELIQRCHDLMEKTVGERKLTLRYAPPAEKLTVLADASVIERVVNNLLNNAMKYAPRGSEILITSEQRENMAIIGVTNWGEPIPPDFHQKVFELFCRVEARHPSLPAPAWG